MLLDLLEGLGEEWDHPTECPGWSVKGIVVHLLGNDVALLARQRDNAPPAVQPKSRSARWEDLMPELDAFNERWVSVAGFMSPQLAIDLLRLTGEWTLEWYSTADPHALGEPIHWIGPMPATYRMLAGREFLERWIHHWQISRATTRRGPAIQAFETAVENATRGSWGRHIQAGAVMIDC